MDYLKDNPPSFNDKVLEIGCGWGGFMEHAIKNNDVFVKGLTISEKQLNYASNRMNIAGLYENGEVVLQDYRDEKGLYDAIVSIEMFEAAVSYTHLTLPTSDLV